MHKKCIKMNKKVQEVHKKCQGNKRDMHKKCIKIA